MLKWDKQHSFQYGLKKSDIKDQYMESINSAR